MERWQLELKQQQFQREQKEKPSFEETSNIKPKKQSALEEELQQKKFESETSSSDKPIRTPSAKVISYHEAFFIE